MERVRGAGLIALMWFEAAIACVAEAQAAAAIRAVFGAGFAPYVLLMACAQVQRRRAWAMVAYCEHESEDTRGDGDPAGHD